MSMRYYPKDGKFEPSYEADFSGEFEETPVNYNDDNKSVEVIMK